MPKQLVLPGLPGPLHREAYTAPPQASDEQSKGRIWQPIEQAVSVSPTHYTFFNDLSGISKRTKMMHLSTPPKVERIINTGTLSPGAASKMKRAFGYLALISKIKRVKHAQKGYKFDFKMNFITLTISQEQKHTDGWIKNNMLKNFIDALRKRYPAISYIWKAETQKNGNIHFHICTDHFIPVAYINYLWNRIQHKNGYLDKYFAAHGHINAPSAEVRKIKGNDAATKYMRKYMLKNIHKTSIPEVHAKIDSLKNKKALSGSMADKNRMNNEIAALYRLINELKKRKIQGKLWGCSDRLLLAPFVCWLNMIPMEDRIQLHSNEVLVTTEYFQVFKVPAFHRFFYQFSTSFRDELLCYYDQLKSKIQIPDIAYNTDMNYSYS